VRRTEEPVMYSMEAVILERQGYGRVREYSSFFGKLRARRLVHGYLYLRRVAAPRTVFTVRRTMDARTQVDHTEWLLNLETRVAESGPMFLLAERPRASPEAELVVKHRLEGGEVKQGEHVIHGRHPFQTDLQCPRWMAVMLSRADGKRTGAELYESLIADRLAPKGAEEMVAKALAALVSGGMVQVTGLEAPAYGEIHG
jgi:hypothetical protein